MMREEREDTSVPRLREINEMNRESVRSAVLAPQGWLNWVPFGQVKE